MKITYDSELKEDILNAFNKKVNDEGNIIEKDTGDEVISFDGEVANIDSFGGIINGSELFIKKDLPSLLKLSER